MPSNSRDDSGSASNGSSLEFKGSENPFAVFSPEGLPANDVIDLFVKDVPGVDSIQSDGNTLLLGARGSGKSMILRFMEPDCQRLLKNTGDKEGSRLDQIPYYAAYLTIRQTDLSYPELERLRGTVADHLINEHFLVISIALKVISRALENELFTGDPRPVGQKPASELSALMARVGRSADVSGIQQTSSVTDILLSCKALLEKAFNQALEYLQQLVDSEKLPPYSESLVRFSNFLLPFLEAWRSFPGMPTSKRFFLLIDDADKLNDTQTRIVNTWLAQRLSEISIKVSAELYEYSTFNTLGHSRIEAPHDYQEINLSDIYTSNKGDYYRHRIYAIVSRRLNKFGARPDATPSIDALRFFPEDKRQLGRIERIANEIRDQWKKTGRGYRARDDVYRYSRPEFMRQLGGVKKSRHTYSYSGFNQLVNISSGVPRFFLEAAHKMFDSELMSFGARLRVSEISPETQDKIIRQQAEDIYMKELEKLKLDQMKSQDAPASAVLLHNLIGSLGGLFETILLDESLSERRVFSFAISDFADDEVSAVLRLGVKHSYLQRTTIGRKEGFGRTERYILTRRLAPLFNLDPNGFSAYKFVTNNELREMMTVPDRYRKNLRKSRSRGNAAEQLDFELFGIEE